MSEIQGLLVRTINKLFFADSIGFEWLAVVLTAAIVPLCSIIGQLFVGKHKILTPLRCVLTLLTIFHPFFIIWLRYDSYPDYNESVSFFFIHWLPMCVVNIAVAYWMLLVHKEGCQPARKKTLMWMIISFFLWIAYIFFMACAIAVFDGGKDAEVRNRKFQELSQEEKDLWFPPEKLKEYTPMDFPPYHVTEFREGWFPADGFSDTIKLKFVKPLNSRLLSQFSDSCRKSPCWQRVGKWYVLKYKGDDEFTSWGNGIFISKDSLHFYSNAH